MNISESTIAAFNELEIISHCLYEMTFCGYDENVIQAEWKEIEKSSEELKNMTAEERAKNTISFDDLMKELGEDEN